MKKPIIIITGPTAVGKTDISIQLAKEIQGEIISADSVQVYKGLNIGSAKISIEEMQGIQHYLVDEIEPEEDFNVYRFKCCAKEYVKKIHEKGKIPIVAGGTGFYIQSLLYDVDFSFENLNPNIRKELEELALKEGSDVLYNLLSTVDPESAREIHPNNIKRVIRAIEYFKQTGQKISEHNKIQKENVSPYNFVYFVLNMNRKLLYERINQRVDKMISSGLREEVSMLRQRGLKTEMVSMQGIGYKEMMECMDGKIDFENAIDNIKKNSRHFAKRQITWFKREKDVEWLNYEEFDFNQDEILKEMLRILKNRGIIK